VYKSAQCNKYSLNRNVSEVVSCSRTLHRMHQSQFSSAAIYLTSFRVSVHVSNMTVHASSLLLLCSFSAFVALFTLPKVYESNKAQIDQNLDIVRSKIADITSK